MELGTIAQEAAACRKAFEGVKVGALAWCVHHEILYEPLTEPPEARIAYILKEKPKWEQARRLHEFRPVLGRVPAAVKKARAAYDKARAAYDKASDAYDKASDACDKARAAYDKASDAYNRAYDAYYNACDAYNRAYDAYYNASDACLPKLEALHKTECPHTTWNGKSIFGGAA